MSELLQSGQFPGASGHHPDADQLSAFIEQALPAHERRQVLAHLAVCPGCREIVALSLPHLELPHIELPQTHALELARNPWFRNWNILVPAAAAALAASIFFAVSVHRANAPAARNASTQPEQIANAQPPAMTLQEQVTAPRSAAPIEKKSRPATVLAPAAPLIENRQVSQLPAPPQPAPFTEAVIAPELAKSAAPSAAAKALAPVPAVAASPAPAAPKPSNALANSAATETVAVNREARTLDTVSANLALNLPAPAHAITLSHPLPGGQPPLSVAANGPAILAIDAHNAVFFSRDAGKHWTAVTTPWQGRAVKAELIPANLALHGAAYGSSAGTLRAFADVAPPSPSSTAGITGIVTDAIGAVIPNATVTLRNTATGDERTLTTDADGRYLAANLAPGVYTLDAQSMGFMPLQQAGITLEASKQSTRNLTLQIGSSSQTVEVTAESHAAPRDRAAKDKAPKAAAPVAPPSLFTITTDTGEHWTSTDGLSWQRK